MGAAGALDNARQHGLPGEIEQHFAGQAAGAHAGLDDGEGVRLVGFISFLPPGDQAPGDDELQRKIHLRNELCVVQCDFIRFEQHWKVFLPIGALLSQEAGGAAHLGQRLALLHSL